MTEVLGGGQWTKSPSCKTDEGDEIVESPTREGSDFVYSVQINFAQTWTNNGCITKGKGLDERKMENI